MTTWDLTLRALWDPDTATQVPRTVHDGRRTGVGLKQPQRAVARPGGPGLWAPGWPATVDNNSGTGGLADVVDSAVEGTDVDGVFAVLGGE